MSVTISAGNGAGTTSPLTVLSPYEAARASRNVIHDLIGGGIAVSLVAPRLRAGTIALLYTSEDAAFAALNLHAEETTFTLNDTSRPHIAMTYVVDGDVAVALDEDTLTAWVVSVGFQEVQP